MDEEKRGKTEREERTALTLRLPYVAFPAAFQAKNAHSLRLEFFLYPILSIIRIKTHAVIGVPSHYNRRLSHLQFGGN